MYTIVNLENAITASAWLVRVDRKLWTSETIAKLQLPVSDTAREMVAVLNRDLENRANDIAATPENIATSDQPLTEDDKHRKLWRNAPTGCGDQTCKIHYPGDLIAGPDKGCPASSSHITDNGKRDCERGVFCPWVHESLPQEEPPEMPNASDDCGNSFCPECHPEVVGVQDARLVGNALLEHESALRKVVPEDEVRSIKPENYAGAGDGPDVDIAMDPTGIHPSPLELEYLNGLDRDEDPEHGR